MKVVDGKNIVMGRLASYVAKELLRGEEIKVINCGGVIITGNKDKIKEEFLAKRRKAGRKQRGPVYIRADEMVVKRTIRGMLPNYRRGRGREVWKKLKCYMEIPKELENTEKIIFNQNSKKKTNILKNLK